MRKLKITAEQYNKILANLNESKDIKGGINRVNKAVKSQVDSIAEDLNSVVTKPLPGVSGTAMKNKKEIPMPTHQVNEDIFSPELHNAIKNVIESIWVNPSQDGLDPFLKQHGVTWGDILLYLTTIGVVVSVPKVGLKVANFFKRVFSKDPNQAMLEKKEEIEKITKKIEKDPKAPWSQNTLKDPEGQQTAKPVAAAPKEAAKPTTVKVAEVGLEEMSPDNYYDAEPHPDSPDANRAQPQRKAHQSAAQQVFKPIAIGGEIAILEGPDGKYAFYFGDIDRNELGEQGFRLEPQDLADYVNDNLSTIRKGDGLKDFDNAELVKLDDPLKAELMNLYAKDHKLVGALQGLSETTGAGSSGAFVGPIAFGSKLKEDETSTPEEPIEEITTAASSGQYTQPAFLAKDKKNFEGASKTQYPGGEMVTFDKCTKYNNNKSAENGGCSQGAVDNVVKTHKTKNSVISRNIYTEIAKKTGRSVEAVQELIESKLGGNKSL